MQRKSILESESETGRARRVGNSTTTFGFNVRSGNQVAYDGNAMALQGLAQGIASLDPDEQVCYYLDSAPKFGFFRSQSRRQAVGATAVARRQPDPAPVGR